jgi:hypothetical protein
MCIFPPRPNRTILMQAEGHHQIVGWTDLLRQPADRGIWRQDWQSGTLMRVILRFFLNEV